MALILNIDTATENASVCIADGDRVLSIAFNDNPKQHATFLQPAVQQLIAETGINLKDLDAVAVSNGPGSYTGLRVGLSSAKGMCYVIGKPLITINTLQIIAAANIHHATEKDLLIPMIDARRMEVFAAVYSASLDVITEAEPVILSPESFRDVSVRGNLIFCGSGAKKWSEISTVVNAIFSQTVQTAAHLNILAQKAFLNGIFADLAYAEPYYTKAFHDTHKL